MATCSKILQMNPLIIIPQAAVWTKPLMTWTKKILVWIADGFLPPCMKQPTQHFECLLAYVSKFCRISSSGLQYPFQKKAKYILHKSYDTTTWAPPFLRASFCRGLIVCLKGWWLQNHLENAKRPTKPAACDWEFVPSSLCALLLSFSWRLRKENI